MERLPVAEPLRGSDFRGKAALNVGLGETDLQQAKKGIDGSCDLSRMHQRRGVLALRFIPENLVCDCLNKLIAHVPSHTIGNQRRRVP